MDIDIRADISRIESQLNTWQRQVIPKATSRALNTTARNVRTAAQRHIAKTTGLKVGEVRDNFHVTRATPRWLSVKIIGRRKPFNLIRFVAPSKRTPGAFRKARGVRANPWRNARTFPGTFIIRSPRSGVPIVVKRKGQARQPIEAVFGPSIHTEFNRRESRRLMTRTARERFRVNFMRDVKFYISRLKP